MPFDWKAPIANSVDHLATNAHLGKSANLLIFSAQNTLFENNSKSLIFKLVHSAICLHLPYKCQLFVYIYPTNVSCLLTFPTDCLYHGTIFSCLFIFILRMSAVYLHFQLFVYIMVLLSAVCLYHGNIVSCLFTLTLPML